jgi:DNA-binding transcriptional ArsR family regulator
MLKIFFTGDDLARTRVMPGADPLWEIVLSLHVLQTRPAHAAYGDWHQAISADLRRPRPGRPGLIEGIRFLITLNPAAGYFPDFLTPLVATQGLDAGLATIAATPAAMLGRDLTLLGEQRPLPSAMLPLARGEAAAMVHLTRTLRDYFDLALAPHWSTVETAVEADRARRVRALGDGGTEALLESLRPAMRWRGGELAVDYPFDQEMHLDGRGLVLVPSYFCWRYPVTLLDPRLPPVLVYPADRSVANPPEIDRRALGALLGHTRAAVLAAIGDGCSTGDLARRVGVSPAAASQHATVLRNAGLVARQRDRNTVLHTLTALGRAVLSGR